ncbi:hypothetical protein, partial [Kistimonas scapharcae]|uniref:hypothetical protein n=1 Tax=Kistimonas scapharcae TaxID=1036133 RepID=UPI0031E9FD07
YESMSGSNILRIFRLGSRLSMKRQQPLVMELSPLLRAGIERFTFLSGERLMSLRKAARGHACEIGVSETDSRQR